MSLLIARGQPRGHEVRELRERAGFVGSTGRAELADRLHCTEQKLKNWETERYEMPESTWLLMRITCDPLARSQWIQSLLREKKR